MQWRTLREISGGGGDFQHVCLRCPFKICESFESCPPLFQIRIQALKIRIQALKIRIQALKIRIQAFKVTCMKILCSEFKIFH